MIVKILPAVRGFPGVRYNTNKVDKNRGELMRVANFGALQGLSRLRPKDYINYLESLSALNANVRKSQFHAVISGKGKTYDKEALAVIAGRWLQEMGYGEQPYLIIFHKDTDNNHVHLVTTRVGRDGRKIEAAYEKVRAMKSMDKVLGYSFALEYRFSTPAQFYMVLESNWCLGKDYDPEKLEARIAGYMPDRERIAWLKDLLNDCKSEPGFKSRMLQDYGIQLVFHAAEGKQPYGYTIIDHTTKQVFKGSEVLGLKYLLSGSASAGLSTSAALSDSLVSSERSAGQPNHPIYVRPVWIAPDIDDEAIKGRNRRKKKKARTNTR